jgi:spore germination protein KC
MLILLLQTGCWNAREIDELAFVMGIALDKTQNNEIKVTVQIAKPDTHSKTPSGGGGGPEKERPFWVASSTGKTIFEAIRNMAAFSSRRIFWSHIKVIIIGEELAKSDIIEIFDFFGRNPELRLRTWIAVAPGEAGKLMEVVPVMERDPALALERVIDHRNLTGKAYGIMLKDFLEDYLSPDVYPAASRIVLGESSGMPVLVLKGAAIFAEEKMAGWLDDQETRGLLWLKQRMRSSIMVVNCPFEGLPLSIEITGNKAKYTSQLEEGRVRFDIQVKTSGNLTEKSCLTDYNDPENLKVLETTLAEAVNADIQSTINAAQQRWGIDFLGLGQIAHQQHRKGWPEISGQWTNMFKETEISVLVDAEIPNVALFGRPLQPKKPRTNSTEFGGGF